MVDDVAPPRSWVPWLLGLLGLAGAYYGARGYAMAGSFSVAHPERLAHWQRVGGAYLALVGVSFLLIAGAAVALLRRRARRREHRN